MVSDTGGAVQNISHAHRTPELKIGYSQEPCQQSHVTALSHNGLQVLDQEDDFGKIEKDI